MTGTTDSEEGVLTDVQVRRYGQYPDHISDEQLRRFFSPSSADRADINRMRSDWTRLGYAVQLGTVRFLGRFPEQPERTPDLVVRFVARELGVAVDGWRHYLAQDRTRFQHQHDICALHGYTAFGEGPLAWGFGRFLWRRAWTGAQRPSLLVDLATGWLVDHRVLLPGISTLTRTVGRVRERTARKTWRHVNTRISPATQRGLLALLELDPATKVSRLELLRRPPRSPTIDGLLGALDRLAAVQALNVGQLDLAGIPAARLKALADDATSAWVQRLARRRSDRRLATLAAFAHQLHRGAHDDVIDAYLAVAGDLFSRAVRAATKDRLATLADLDAAALVLRRAALVVLDDDVGDLDVRRLIFELVGRDELRAAADIVGELLEPDADERHRRLLTRYPTLRRFWPKLLATVRFDSTVPDDPVIAAVDHLRQVEAGSAQIDDAPTAVVPPSWRPLALDDQGKPARRGYTLCVAEQAREEQPNEKWR